MKDRKAMCKELMEARSRAKRGAVQNMWKQEMNQEVD